ncbi:MAG: PQQ-binding-like beta-propeller repeat protein [Planctomycetaceae bacterium]
MPSGEPSTADPPSGQSHLSAQRTALNPLLIRDRRHHLLLKRGTQSLQDGRSLEAISHLQALLDASQDAFFWGNDASQPRGARSEVIGQFHSSPDSVRQDYERLFGDRAKDLFVRYLETCHDEFLVELTQRYGPSNSARDAAVHQLLLSHDTGHHLHAQEWARFLAADPFHWNGLSPSLKNLVDRHLSEAVAHDVSPTQRYRPEHFQSTQLVSHVSLDEQPRENPAPYPVPIWTARFDADLPASVSDQADVLNNPDYTAANVISESHGTWMHHLMDFGLPVASVNDAIVADDVLIFRDFTHARAVNLFTGQEIWRYACASSLAAAAQSLEQPGHGHQGNSLDFHARFSGNSVFGRLATDEHCVFLIDQCTSRSPFPDQLVALPVRNRTAETSGTSTDLHLANPLWMRGTHSGIDHDDLRDAAFLGCPLCVDGRLYLLVEADQQISLFALDAGTGRTIWKQPIALVERPVTEDALRLRTSCTPVYHNGIICCPTEIGVVVGVEALTGRLEWVYDHMNDEQRSNSGRWAYSRGRNSDRALLPNHVYLQHGRLIYLPVRSQEVHCLDVVTGRLIWKQPRNNAIAIGGVTESSVLLLGDRECVALNSTDGRLLWQTSTPEPAGTGIVSGDLFLLPISNGPCLSINLRDGQIESRRFNRLMHRLSGDDQASAGNLLAHEHVIIATTPLGIRVYPQAQHRLARLRDVATRRPLSSTEQLLHAQLLMTIGEIDTAGEVLQQLLVFDPSEEIQQETELLLREVLYARLDNAKDPFPTLQQLADMAHTDDEQLRLQLSRLSVSLQYDDALMLIETLDAFQSLPTSTLITLDGDESYTVSAEQCFRDRLSMLLDDEQPQLNIALTDYLESRSLELLQSKEVPDLERFVTLFADWPETRPVQSLLAERWIAAGRTQEAEQLLLSHTSDDGTRAPAVSSRLLNELYVAQGMRWESEQQLTTGRKGVSSEPVWKTRLARLGPDAEFLSLRMARPATLNPVDALQTAMIEQASTPTLAPRYQVLEHLCTESCNQGEECGCQRARRLRDTEGLRRVFVPQLSGSILVLDQGSNKSPRTHSRLTLVDRETGLSQGVVDVPSAYWPLPRPTNAGTGHMMVISNDATHGISLLEAKTLWSIVPETSRRTNEKIKVGPIGTDFCVLQSTQELQVVHPATGRTLWKRTHLPPGIGLQGNESIGILGDSQSLCVFDEDQTSYTLYHTQSGREIREGTRILASGANRRNRWAVGRHLVEVVSDATGSRLSIWDSLNDRLTMDIPLAERLVAPLPGDEDFACITSDGRLQVIHADNAEFLLDVSFEDSTRTDGRTLLEELLASSSLIAFADRDRFYINFATDSDKTELNLTAPTDEFDLPHIRVRGRLIAIDRVTSKLLWSRIVPDACLPVQPEAAPAVLTLLSRATDDRPNRTRGHTPQTTSLTVEFLDPLTGITLAHREQLLRTRIVGYQCHSMSSIKLPGEPQQFKNTRVPGQPFSVSSLTSSTNSHVVVASLIGMDSQISIQFQEPTSQQPLRVAADEANTTNR